MRGAWVEIFSSSIQQKPDRSLPVRGAWVEISRFTLTRTKKHRSLPVRGAWVEIEKLGDLKAFTMSRSPCGERGLKFLGGCMNNLFLESRSPCGERGLK